MRTLTIITLLFLPACSHDATKPQIPEGKGKGDDPSHHIGGQPTNGPWRFQWYDADDADVETYKRTILPGRGRIVGTDHSLYPLQLRLQKYVDAMDAYVRRVNPDQVIHTPHPKVRIYDDPDFLNAWASGVPVCVDAPVSFVSNAAQPGAKQYASVMLHHSSLTPLKATTPGHFGQPPRPLEPCIDASISGTAEMNKFVGWMNQKRGACKYAWRDGKLEISGDGCKIEHQVKDFAGATYARYYAVIPHVFIATGFLKLITHGLAFKPGADEAAIVGVLAHELGHFYKSHTTNADFSLTAGSDIFEGDGTESYVTGYNYFYTQTLSPEPIKPQPRLDSNEIRDQVLRYSPNQANPLKGVEGAKLDPTVAEFILKLIYAETVSCAAAKQLLYDNSLFDVGFIKQLSAAQKDAYKQIESLFLDCAGSVQVESGGALEPKRLVSSFSPPMRRQIDATSFQMQGSLYDVIMALDATMRDYSADEEAFYSFLDTNRIGYYTSEQEADEMAVELLANIGLDPEAHAKFDLQGGHLREKEASEWFGRLNRVPGRKPGQSVMDRCEELYQNDWIDPSNPGAGYQFIPIGDLTGIHHGLCYRAFNSKRELVAHQAEYAAAVPVQFTFDHEWQHFRDLLGP